VDEWKIRPAQDLNQTGLTRYRNPRREHGLVSGVVRFGWWTAVRQILRFVNRLAITGRENVPAAGPTVLVCNHASHFDTLVIGAALSARQRTRLHPLAAGDVFFETPATAAFAAHVLNALPVWRRNVGRHGLDELRAKLLDESAIYILYPEGTRSRDGAMAAFKPGVGMLVAGTPARVVPCYLHGTHDAFPVGRYLPRRKHVRLTIGPARVFGETENKRGGWEAIAAILEDDVKRLGGVTKLSHDLPST
jgi:1-acyl-sn-glycerol-3-phosphate acyltransferase